MPFPFRKQTMGTTAMRTGKEHSKESKNLTKRRGRVPAQKDHRILPEYISLSLRSEIEK